MSRMFSIGMIAMAIGCAEPNPLATDDTSSGTSGATTTMSTTTESTTVSTTTMSTTDTLTTTTTTTTTMSTTETTDDPTTGEVDTSTGAAACDTSSHRCVPEAPDGWEGPVALRYSDAADEDPGCAVPYDEPGVVAYANLAVGAHDCDCQCGAAQNVQCSDVTLFGDDSIGCGSPLGSMMVDEDCTAMPGNLQITGMSFWRATATITAGTCAEQPTADVGPAQFGDRIALCGAAADPGECAVGETCTPLPGADHDGRICVWQLGDVECPDDVWSDRTPIHEDFDDTRGCTACSCGDVDGECGGAVGIGTESDCIGGQGVATISVNGNCQQGASALQARGASINGSLSPVDPQCTPSTSVETGSIGATGPVTQCCLPPE